MRIYWNITEGGIVREVYEDVIIADRSYRYKEIMGDNNVILNFSLTEFIDFPVGAWILFTDITGGAITESERYTLMETGNVTKVSERQYDYTLTFESVQFQLSRYKFRNHVDGRLNFTLTAQPREFIQHIINNLNGFGRDSGWTIGSCVESTEKTQSFSHNSIIDALNSIASLFETEWEIDSANKCIHLRKTEYFKDSPLPLSYGKGNGFKSGISRQKGQENAIDVLYVEGGDRNIDSSTYTYTKTIKGKQQTLHSNVLRLPKNQQFYYKPDGSADGTGKGFVYTAAEIAAMFPGEHQGEIQEFVKDAMIVTTDEDGFGIFRKNKINFGLEDSLELTEIYPKKELKITDVFLENKDKRFWNITVGQNDVDYNTVIIAGTKPTVIFQDGMLEGKEFEFSAYDHDTKTFQLVPQAIDGITMPDLAIDDRDSDGHYGSGYIPAVGQTVAVFHVNLPQSYIVEAEKEMLLEACQYLYKHGEVEVEFNGVMDGIWSRKRWEEIRSHIRLGGFIKFFDNSLCKEGKDIRITAVKEYLNNPHAPEITLSNTTIQQGVSSQLKKIAQNEVYTQHSINVEHYEQVRYTERTYRAAKQELNDFKDETEKKREEDRQRISNNEKNIADNDYKINLVGKEVDEQGRQITALDDHLSVVDGQIVDIDGNIVDIGDHLKVVDGQIFDLNGNIVNINNHFSVVDGQIVDLNGNIVNINNHFAVVDGKIVAINGDIVDMKNVIAETAKNVWENYEKGISPQTVETMKLLVGDESTQFEFGVAYNSENAQCSNGQVVKRWVSTQYQPSFNQETNTFSNSAIILKHVAYTETADNGEVKYPYWYIKGKNQEIPPEFDGKTLKIYIQAAKGATASSNLNKQYGDSKAPYAEFVLSPDLLSHTDTYYYLLFGFLDNNRNISSVYGYTEVSGNHVTAGVIKSKFGDTYFDLDHNLLVGNITIKDGTIQSELILGNKRSPNLGGLTYKEILDGTKAAVGSSYPIDYDGKRVIMWLGDAEFLSNGRLKCQGVKFYKDGSFTINGIINQKAGESMLYVRKNTDFYYSVNIEDDLTVGSDGSGNLEVNGAATIHNSITIGKNSRDTNHYVYGSMTGYLSNNLNGVYPVLVSYCKIDLSKADTNKYWNAPNLTTSNGGIKYFYGSATIQAGRPARGVALIGIDGWWGNRHTKANTIIICNDTSNNYYRVYDRTEKNAQDYNKGNLSQWSFAIEIFDTTEHDDAFEVMIFKTK